MVTDNSAKAVLLGTLAILLLSSVSGAEEAQIDFLDKDNKVIWLNGDQSEKTFNAELVCHEGYVAKEMKILKGGSVEHDSPQGVIEYSFAPDAQVGSYTIKGTCEKNGSEEKTDSENFRIMEVNPELLRPKYNDIGYRNHFMGDEKLGELYKGTATRVETNLKGEPDDFELSESDFSFNVQLSRYNSGQDGLDKNFDVKSNELIKVHPFVPSNVPGGRHNLNLKINYNSEKGDFTESVGTSNEPLYITSLRVNSINPDDDILFGDVGNINLDLFLEKDYRKYGISEDDFILKIDGESYSGVFNLKKNEDKEGVYRLKLDTVPDLPTEKEEFEVDIFFKDVRYAQESSERFIEIASYEVTSKVPFEGFVRNVEKQPVNTRFKISNQDEFVQFDTQSNGFYSKKFDPGNYTAEINFFKGGENEGSLQLQDVVMQPQFESRIRFEYKDDPGNIDVKGINPINTMAVQFGHPFNNQGSTATMQFDTKGIDPTTVSVFECNKWDFQGEECLSSWDRIPDSQVSPNPAKWELQFPVEPLVTKYFDTDREILMSAYAVGTKAELQLDSPMEVNGVENGRVKKGGDVSLQGRIVSSSGERVSGANVTVSFMEGNNRIKSLTSSTDTEGKFNANGEVPDEPGNYSLKVEAEKQPYESFEKRSDKGVWVFLKEGLKISRVEDEDTTDIVIGEDSKLGFNLENTGQTAIKNVELKVEGLEEQLYSLSKKSFSNLGAGESRRVTLTVSLPEDYCDNGSCDEYPSIELRATGEGEKDTRRDRSTVQAVVNQDASSGQNQGNTGNDNNQNSGDTQEKTATKEDNGNGSLLSPNSITEPTGEFIRSQSSLNIALGLIMVFTMVMAGAIKKRKGSDGNRRMNGRMNGGGRSGTRGQGSRVQRPNVAGQGAAQQQPPQQDTNGEEVAEDVDDSVEKMAQAMEGTGEEEQAGENDVEEDSDSGEESSSTECSICGEEFDTESAKKLHEQAIHE